MMPSDRRESIRVIEHGSPEYEQMVDLRFRVLREPLGLSFTQEELEADRESILLGFFDGERLEGCCRLDPVDTTTIRLRSMAVTPGSQRRGIGRALMRFAEDVSGSRGYKTIMMHARKTAVRFYEKLGYERIGSEFIDVTIPHYLLKKAL
jgi:GNAT superfamily N-acetyltransferase